MSDLEYSYDLTASATASASEVMANFDDVATYASLVGGDRIDPENPIDKTGISDRFIIVPVVLEVVPFTSDASWESTALFTLPGTMTTIGPRHRQLLATGQRASLQKIEYYAEERDADAVTTTDYPQMQFFKNTVQVGDTVNPIVAGAWVEAVALADPGSMPIAQLADNDSLTVKLGGQNGTAATRVRGLTVVFHVKVELCS